MSPSEENFPTRIDLAEVPVLPPDNGAADDPLLPALMRRGIKCLEALESTEKSSAAQLHDLGERLREGRFQLAVLGQFKRGKSTLLNALLGESVLPTSVIPLTAIPTFIRAGDLRRVRVLFSNGRSAEEITAPDAATMAAFLSRFVTESGNPHNRLNVSHVDVSHPAAILRKGVVLIDTPGIGSTYRHNTDAALAFLPQCDAAVFLVSADPPITEVEIEFLKHVRARVTRLFFVLNKMDYLNAEERLEASRFLKSVLAEQGFSRDELVLPVSARRGLDSKSAGDAAGWTESGMSRVEAHLVEFLVREKMATLTTAIARKSADVVANALLRLNLTIRALQLPLDDLHARLGIFEQKLPEIERERLTMKDLLAGEKQRMRDTVEAEYLRVSIAATPKLHEIVRATMAQTGRQLPNEQAMHAILEGVMPDLFGGLFTEIVRAVEDRLAEVLRPHQQRADALIESVRQTAADLFEVPFQPVTHMATFDRGRPPYWKTYWWESSIGPIPPGLIDKLLPERMRRSRVEKRFRGKVESLILRNAGELREVLSRRVDEAFSRFGKELDHHLSEATRATHGATRAAMERREKQAAEVSHELPRLTTTAAELADLKKSFDAASDASCH